MLFNILRVLNTLLQCSCVHFAASTDLYLGIEHLFDNALGRGCTWQPPHRTPFRSGACPCFGTAPWKHQARIIFWSRSKVGTTSVGSAAFSSDRPITVDGLKSTSSGSETAMSSSFSALSPHPQGLFEPGLGNYNVDSQLLPEVGPWGCQSSGQCRHHDPQKSCGVFFMGSQRYRAR